MASKLIFHSLPSRKTGARTSDYPSGYATPATSDFVSARVCDDVPAEWEEGVATLQAMSCPENVPAKAWANLITNSVRFIGSTFAARTAALGWRTADLWGCQAVRPWQRIDRLGVLWLVHDSEFVAVTADAITIRTSTGPRLTSRRLRPALSGVCLAWELGT